MYTDEGLIAEFDGSGSQTKAYGYRPGSTWTTDPLFMNQGGQYYFYQNDHLGTPQKHTNASGAIGWSAKYESFGKAVVDPTSTVVNNLRFPGQYYDSETGLHYNYHRYYDPRTGRYTASDPIGLGGGLHLFTYTGNCPTRGIDSTGLVPYVDSLFGRTYTSACNPMQRQELDAAFRDVERAIDSGCIKGQQLKLCLKEKLTKVSVHCQSSKAYPWDESRNVCGSAWVNSESIVITSLGFDPESGCGALKSTLLHELIHACGHSGEEVSEACEMTCFDTNRHNANPCECGGAEYPSRR